MMLLPSIQQTSEISIANTPQGDALDSKIDASLDRLLVEFGREILNIIPGRVSTEVDARFSFDTAATVSKAVHIIGVRQIPPSS